MADYKALFFALSLFFCFSSMGAAGDNQPLKVCDFDQIYQFGDSISDTGNYAAMAPKLSAFPCIHLPYGQTYFKNATGRCSNGLLLVDFIAKAAGLPFLNPYKNIDGDFRHGANFADAGATALPGYILKAKNITVPFTVSSLDMQLDWMLSHFNSICLNNQDCARKLKTALFIVGVIGGNDYNFPLLIQKKSVQELKPIVPDVVNAIVDGVKKVIRSGGVKIVVPGGFPRGCLPIYLTIFQTNDSAAYDENRCLKDLNNLSMYHNDVLKQAIQNLQKEYPNTVILYADYYNAFMNLISVAPSLGFDEGDLQKVCCGIGGDYNFSLNRTCGKPGVPVCSRPDKRIFFDGTHITQEGNRIITDWLINDLLPKLNCLPIVCVEPFVVE